MTSKRGGRRYPPYVFTQEGVAMLSSVLNSERAILVNIQIMRAFTQLRRMLLTNKDLKRKIEEMEKNYDKQFAIVFQAIKQLLEPPPQNQNRKSGFALTMRIKRLNSRLSNDIIHSSIITGWYFSMKKGGYMNLKKIPVVAILVLELITISIHAFAEQDNSASGDNQNTETAATQDYYDKLARSVKHSWSKNCCLASVKAMKAGNYTLVPEEGCPAGYQPNMLKCKESYTWCEPIENTSQETAGQNTNPSPRQPATATKSNPATSTGRQSLNDKTILPVGFPLKSGHKLYMEYDASIVPMGKLFDLEVSSGNLTQVKTVDELSKLTGQINAKEQALAFVKFLPLNQQGIY